MTGESRETPPGERWQALATLIVFAALVALVLVVAARFGGL